jgi:hypothetical protein
VSGRVEALAKRFEQTNDEVIVAVERCSDEQWGQTCSGEPWSVGVTAHHIGISHVPVAELVWALATGQSVPTLTSELLDVGNSEHARQFAGCTKAETIELLRRGGQEAADLLRGLSDEQLENGAKLPLLDGRRVTAARIVELVLIGHPVSHLGSIRAAL